MTLNDRLAAADPANGPAAAERTAGQGPGGGPPNLESVALAASQRRQAATVGCMVTVLAGWGRCGRSHPAASHEGGMENSDHPQSVHT